MIALVIMMILGGTNETESVEYWMILPTNEQGYDQS